jgi:hypothetical protein
MFAALIVNFGWSVDGPGRVAGRSREERSRIFRLSLTSRFITCIITLPVAGLIAYFAAPAFRTSSALIAVATALAGALPSWYFIGICSPFSLAIFDTIPRFLAAFASVLVLIVLPSEYVYPIMLLAMMSTSIVVSAVRISGRTLIAPSRADWVLLRRNFILVFSGIVSSTYTSLSVAIVAVVSPSSVAVFAAASRFRDFGVSGLMAITNGLQGWVSEVAIPSERQRRRRLAFSLNAAAGIFAGAALAIGLPAVDTTLFSGSVDVGYLPSCLAGISLTLIAMSMSITFHVLAPSGRIKIVATSGIITAFVGFPLILYLTPLLGAVGALTAIACAEAVSLAIQSVAWKRMEGFK